VAAGKHEETEIGLAEVLGEFRLLIAVSGILFGFLLNLSISGVPPAEPRPILTIALASAALSILAFLMPVIYHHTRSFPLTARERRKVYVRSHRFALWGVGALIAAIYFALVLALLNSVGTLAYAIAALILSFPAILFATRKVGVHEAS
jgi:hypothetical protein